MSHAGGVTTYHNITSDGLARRYAVHLPANYSAENSYPVIVGFHGSSSIGLFFQIDTKLDQPRFTGDKITVYPDGVDGTWAGPSYHNGSTVAQDLQFVSDVLADIKPQYCIDDTRIYATGISNGGGFVGTLACNDTVGGQFAAFAPAAGSFYTDAGPNATDGCTPARSPMPMMEFHGGADQSVHYEGGQGEGGYEPPIMDWLDFWVERNGCDTPPQVEDSFNNTVHHYVWTCKGQYGALQHWKVDTQSKFRLVDVQLKHAKHSRTRLAFD
ncbi:hypothetical protein LTS18_007477 [Coniosporium uncinatum]|uniref:Uncharacterized protein n=1 Tax=Coniosporium uncinatum TaxID=93489 RepID=A0ACC3DB19_9PEZI|nr:hypothetical protein LTS18_007477 [Coniosporium uncinatum]